VIFLDPDFAVEKLIMISTAKSGINIKGASQIVVATSGR